MTYKRTSSKARQSHMWPLLSLKIFSSLPLSTFCIWPFVICIRFFPNEPFFFHYSVKISLFTCLYSHPIELSPSPRGPNPFTAGYLSFQYNASTHTPLSTAPSTGCPTATHARNQLSKGLFSKQMLNVNLYEKHTRHPNQKLKGVHPQTLQINGKGGGIEKGRPTAGDSGLSVLNRTLWCCASAHGHTITRPGFASGK